VWSEGKVQCLMSCANESELSPPCLGHMRVSAEEPEPPSRNCRCGPENGLVRQETFKVIIRSEVVGCGCRSELTATITTVVSR
jgi:hypothetical protein